MQLATLSAQAASNVSFLDAWRAECGPEAMRSRSVQGAFGNQNTDGSNQLTVDELAQRLGALNTSYAGKNVTEFTARGVAAVYACVALLAGAVASSPCTIYERTMTERKPVEHKYWWLLNEQPNPDISAATFWEFLTEASLYHGDQYAEIIRPGAKRSGSNSMEVAGLLPHHPISVQPFRNFERNGQLLYRVNPDFGPSYVLDPADILHIPGLGFNGLRSISPVQFAARQSIGTAMAAEEFSGRFFSGGARPDIALYTDRDLKSDQVDILRSTWTSRYGGTANANAGPVVLTNGLKLQQLSLSAQDSQLILTRGFQIEEICRIFGVPPHMIGHTSAVTSWGSGVEQMGRGFVKFSLRNRLNKVQQELNRKLFPRAANFRVEFDVSGIERGDLKSENEALRIALGRAGEPGWMTQNQVRHAKGLPPDDSPASNKLGLGARLTEQLDAQALADDNALPA